MHGQFSGRPKEHGELIFGWLNYSILHECKIFKRMKATNLMNSA